MNMISSPFFPEYFQADVHKVQEAICSAVDVMQAMEYSISSLPPKVFNLNSIIYLNLEVLKGALYIYLPIRMWTSHQNSC